MPLPLSSFAQTLLAGGDDALADVEAHAERGFLHVVHVMPSPRQSEVGVGVVP